MTKTQPLVTLTAAPVGPPPPPVRIAPAESAAPSIINSVPLGLCWALAAISAAILLIEIRTYIS
jgi:hypothetical protein